jgi:hypothetical protein
MPEAAVASGAEEEEAAVGLQHLPAALEQDRKSVAPYRGPHPNP